SRCDASPYPVRIGAEVRGFDPLAVISRKRVRRTARFAQLAIAAAQEAVADARLPPLPQITERVGVTIATALGGIDVVDSEAPRSDVRAPVRVTPLLLPTLISNMAAAGVSIHFGLHRPSNSSVGVCAARPSALAEAR